MGFNWGSEQCVKFARAYSITWIRNWIRPPEMCMGIHITRYLVVCRAWVSLVGSNPDKLPIDTSYWCDHTYPSFMTKEISPSPQKCVVRLLWSIFAEKKKTCALYFSCISKSGVDRSADRRCHLAAFGFAKHSLLSSASSVLSFLFPDFLLFLNLNISFCLHVA